MVRLWRKDVKISLDGADEVWYDRGTIRAVAYRNTVLLRVNRLNKGVAMTKGTLVKLTHPESGEEDARYIVVEDHGDRVLIEYVCSMFIRPTELVAASEIEPAE
jgi:hypothetical protein